MINMMEFDLDLYSEEAILRAINDYRGIAEIESRREKSSIFCRFVHTQHSLELTMNEFENYVLELTVGMEGEKH